MNFALTWTLTGHLLTICTHAHVNGTECRIELCVEWRLSVRKKPLLVYMKYGLVMMRSQFKLEFDRRHCILERKEEH